MSSTYAKEHFNNVVKNSNDANLIEIAKGFIELIKEIEQIKSDVEQIKYLQSSR